jgi:hypothetical protein
MKPFLSFAYILVLSFFPGGTVRSQDFPLSGYVVDKRSKTPIGYATVTVAGPASTQTDGVGQFILRLHQKKKGDDIHIHFEATDYLPLDRNISLSDLALPPFEMIRVRKEPNPPAPPPSASRSERVTTVAHFTRRLRANSRSDRIYACQVLGGMGNEARTAVPSLDSCLREDPDTAVEVAALEAIVSIGVLTPPVRESLRISLKGGQPPVQLAALDALSDLNVRGPNIIRDLEFAIQHNNLKVAIKAAGMLRTLQSTENSVLLPLLRDGLRFGDAQSLGTVYSILLADDRLSSHLEPDLDKLYQGIGDPLSEDRKPCDSGPARVLIQDRAMHFFQLLAIKRPLYVDSLLLSGSFPTHGLYHSWPKNDTTDAYCILLIQNHREDELLDSAFLRLIYQHWSVACPALGQVFNDAHQIWAAEPLYLFHATNDDILKIILEDDTDFPIKANCLQIIYRQKLAARYGPEIARIAFSRAIPDRYYEAASLERRQDMSIAQQILVHAPSLHSLIADSLRALPSTVGAAYCALAGGLVLAGTLDSIILRPLWEEIIHGQSVYCLMPLARNLLRPSMVSWPGFPAFLQQEFDSLPVRERGAVLDSLAYLHPDPTFAGPILLSSLQTETLESNGFYCLIHLARSDRGYQPILEEAIRRATRRSTKDALRDALRNLPQAAN